MTESVLTSIVLISRKEAQYALVVMRGRRRVVCRVVMSTHASLVLFLHFVYLKMPNFSYGRFTTHVV